MPFMQPDIEYTTMYHVETEMGTEIVPADLVGGHPTPSSVCEFVSGELVTDDNGHPEIERQTGWYARLSAPGYMDATDWLGPCGSEDEAMRELAYHHDVCHHCWAQCWDADTSVRIGPTTIGVEDTAQASADGRPVYRWTIATDEDTWSADDLHGPRIGPEPCMWQMLATLLDFLSAALEAREDRREDTPDVDSNERLFPGSALDALQRGLVHVDDVAIERGRLEEGMVR